MLKVAFWYEFRRRADALIWLALINPPLLLLHALTTDSERPAIEIWFIGLGATFLFCLVGGIVLYFATLGAITRDLNTVLREKHYMDVISRGPQMRQAGPSAEAG